MALRIPNAASTDERFAAERIYNEQVSQGWRHQLFRVVRAVFENNARLSEEGGFIFNWMAENYVDAALMLIRRELDVQAGTENLRNLLEDIIDHPYVLTRARYVGRWQPGDLDIANRAFDSFGPIRVTSVSTSLTERALQQAVLSATRDNAANWR